MSLHEDIIFADPVLKRVFLNDLAFAPMIDHDAIVNIALGKLSKLQVAFHKATSVEFCERLAWQIRQEYFLVRRHCDGYHMTEVERLTKDGCEHVVEFRYADDDAIFLIDYRARAAYRHRYKHRASPPTRHRPRRT